MALSERVGTHLRSNVVAYVALFVALGGTAIAIPGNHNVKAKNLANGAVKSKAIARGAVKAKAIADGAVGTAKIGEGAVTAPKLGASSVTSVSIADNAVTTTKLPDDAVTRQKIVQGAVNGGKLANGSVNSDKVKDASLLAEDFAAGQLSDGFLLTGDGTFTIQRAGRVLVIATLTPSCPAACVISLTLDSVGVPGASYTAGTADQQVTLVGLTPELTAGQHSIALAQTGGAVIGQARLAGVLLQ